MGELWPFVDSKEISISMSLSYLCTSYVRRAPKNHETVNSPSLECENNKYYISNKHNVTACNETKKPSPRGQSKSWIVPNMCISMCNICCCHHDDVLERKRIPHYFPFVEFIPHKGTVMQSFDLFFVVSLNKLLNSRTVKLPIIQDDMTPTWYHCNGSRSYVLLTQTV